jgi:hypothetical protein
MATSVHSSRVGDMIVDFLRDAEAGRTRDPTGGPFTPAAVRSLRRALDHVDASARDVDIAALDAASVELLAHRIVEDEALPPSRLGSIEHALRCLSAYAADRRPYVADPDQVAPPPPVVAPVAGPVVAPTFAMLALGERLGVWTERIIVIALVLTAIGLAIALI